MGRIKFDRDAAAIVVFSEIKSGGNIVRTRLALDTGATYTIIPWKIARTVGLQPELSKERIDIITASGVENVPVVMLENMRVAGSEATGIRAIIHDLPPRSFVDGLLGLNFLRNFNLHLNFREGYLELE